MITIRDQDSIDLLKKLQVNRPTVLTADDAFSYKFSDLVPHAPIEAAQGKTIVGINFKLDDNTDQTLHEIAEALKELAQKHNFFYYLIPFHLSQDQPKLEALHRLMPDFSHLIEPTAEPEILVHYVAAGRYQIFERLHGQIMATMLGTPFLPINYDPKNRSLMAQIGMNDYLLNHTELSKQAIVDAFEKILRDEEIIRKRLSDYTVAAREQALKNHQYLQEMIKNY